MSLKFLSKLLFLILLFNFQLFSQTHINTIVHIVGSCITTQEAEYQIHLLNTDFYDNTEVVFYLASVNSISNSSYNNLSVDTYTCKTVSSPIFSENDYDALNIYVVPNITGGKGFAERVGGNACVIDKDYYGGSTVAHEVGHCLGLYHPSDYECNGQENMETDPNNSCYNRTTAGDLVSDTDPSDNMGIPVDLCGITIPSGTNPNNIMNKTGGTRTVFTSGQIERLEDIAYSMSRLHCDPDLPIRVKNSFGTGDMNVDRNPSNLVSIPSAGKLYNDWAHSSFPHHFEIIDGQDYGISNITQRYKYWSKTGTSNLTSNQEVTVLSPSSFMEVLYTANFINEYDVSFKNDFVGVSSSTYGGQIQVNGSSTSAPTSDYPIEELQNISVKALSQAYNGIEYTFDSWDDGPTSSTRTIYPNNNIDYEANFVGKPHNEGRNLHFNSGAPGTVVKLYWNDNVNSNVDYYQIWRKKGKTGSTNMIGTVAPNIEQYTDWDMQHTNNTSTTNLTKYDVRGHYSTENTFADADFTALYADWLPKMYEPEIDSISSKNAVKSYGLESFPNPFNPTTRIYFKVAHQGQVNIAVYNSIGKKVETLVDGSKSTGEYVVTFDGSRLSSGVYFVTMQVNSFKTTQKILLTK